MHNELHSLGQHLLVGLTGSSLSQEEAKLLSELQPLGIILFRKNLANSNDQWIPALAQLLEQVYSAIGKDSILVSLDHEGGLVHRLYEPVTRFSSALTWGERSFDVGQAMGRELRALGFNCNFAPVLDCWSEPKNTVIGKRAFSTEPTNCGTFATSFARGLESTGVLSCGKHFPGHGATLLDSHFELPILNSSEAELRNRELIPFKEYITSGFQLLMTSHVLYPQLDPERPASLSKRICTELLREQLGYRHTLITDDLEMKALREYSPEQIAVHALSAGVDILLEGNPAQVPALVQAKRMALGLYNALNDGQLAETTLAASRERIAELKKYHSALLAQTCDVSLDCLGCEQHGTLKAEIEIV